MSEKVPEYLAWVTKAEEDWLCIRNELQAEQKPWSVICFHAQQAAEKYLKAFLVAHRSRPERTHDLGKLIEIGLEFDSTLDALRVDGDNLTDYAADVRYPDILAEVEETTARQAVAAAERICAAIRRRLPRPTDGSAEASENPG